MLKLLQNMNLATDNGSLNLACVLLFTERPEWIKPQFIVKAVRYPGNEIHVTEYLDTEDFSGPLKKVFDDSMAFVLHNLQLSTRAIEKQIAKLRKKGLLRHIGPAKGG